MLHLVHNQPRPVQKQKHNHGGLYFSHRHFLLQRVEFDKLTSLDGSDQWRVEQHYDLNAECPYSVPVELIVDHGILPQ